jgi:2-hydroxy-6-oxonona-2,4-dienedioate hydrolase/4,5:9,10-diseco-3-hydroxy-5,9,17-trioxoandrosta-1(10),2-diene-4-oate hydrolase
MNTVADIQGRTIALNGRDFHYLDVGQGEPTILIHGGGPGASGLSNYRRNVGALAQGRRVIVVDLPGYGQSANRPISGGIFDSMAEAVLGLMDALELESASFVGNSLGGGTAMRLALSQPERARKLVLMGSGGSLPIFTPMPTEGLLRMLQFYEGEGPTMEKLRKVIDLLVFDPSAITPELLQERFEACTRPDVIANPPLRGRGGRTEDEVWLSGLHKIKQPTLIVWGREDRVMPLDAAFLLLKTIPNAQLHVFSRCGHWAQWEKADEFNALVADFLDRA